MGPGVVSLIIALLLGGAAHALSVPVVSELHNVERTPDGFKSTGHDPFVVVDAQRAVCIDECCLLLTLRVSQPVPAQVFWSRDGAPWSELRSTSFPAPGSDAQVLVLNLDADGAFRGLDKLRVDLGHEAGLDFDIQAVEFTTPQAVPAAHLPGLIQFRALTSKLHYLPGERIEYRVALRARCYPDRQSSKLLTLRVTDDTGQEILDQYQQYGIRPGARFTDVQGVLEFDRPLPPGRYTLHAESRDQRSGLTLSAAHVFGVQAADDPLVCETPFKFVKDFSVIRGPEARWHVFSITGDFFDNHDWMPDGQERTFSHASSADLRHWTVHPPVLTITDRKHPDGVGCYENRNIWAPHVIHHDGRYWMFYTSVNDAVSQSISLATSDDLFHWTEYERNPVFTLEGVEWANWARTAWADCRDPCVLVDGDRFCLYATAHARPPGEPGAVVVAESHDLIHWSNPQIAVRAKGSSESPQVWKVGASYCMTTSSLGAATYVSDDPVSGWTRVDFPRPNTLGRERFVPTSPSYAEEVVRLPSGDWLMASLTWRHHGNSLYLWRMKCENGRPVSYESPWTLDE